MNTNKIFLIGPMGAGKSSIGKSLALLRQLPFIDIDEEIVKTCRMDIPSIFSRDGEDFFRRIETETLQKCATYDAVIATGGGIVVTPKNLEIMRQDGIVVYLYADVDTQYLRTAHDENRPMLKVDDKKKRLNDLFLARQPLYESVMTFSVDTGANTIRQCLDLIKAKLTGYE